MQFSEEEMEMCDAVSDMSWGEWEGCLLSEIYTPELLSLMESQQPDFSPPNGESLRHVEFRMAQFLNHLLLRFLPETDKNKHQQRHHHHQHHQHQHSLFKKTFGKSRLMLMTTTSSGSDERRVEEREASVRGSCCYCIGVFTHSWPIKCAVAGVLGSSSVMSHKICVDDSSVTVLHHSWRNGWRVKRLNDTAHIRLL